MTWLRRFDDLVFSVSVGNEASVEWTDHMVPVERLIEYVRRIKAIDATAVTFCENYVPWTYKLEPLAAELDFHCRAHVSRRGSIARCTTRSSTPSRITTRW